jgi:hypothetical protein
VIKASICRISILGRWHTGAETRTKPFFTENKVFEPATSAANPRANVIVERRRPVMNQMANACGIYLGL